MKQRKPKVKPSLNLVPKNNYFAYKYVDVNFFMSAE